MTIYETASKYVGRALWAWAVLDFDPLEQSTNIKPNTYTRLDFDVHRRSRIILMYYVQYRYLPNDIESLSRYLCTLQ